MANTLLSQLGDSIFVDGYDGEVILTLVADGTAQAGHLVGQAAGDGIARGVDLDGNLDEFNGIQMKRYDTDLDSAPTGGKIVQVAIPKAGRRYRVSMGDQGGALYVGEPMVFHATQAGACSAGADIEAVHIGTLAKDIADNDLWCELVWGV